MRIILIFLTLLIGMNVRGQDTNYVKINTWSFDNYTLEDSLVTWEMFRRGYIGIPPDYDEANPFEQVMFDKVYKEILFPKGHCFGMDLMSLQLLRYGGYDGFCAPAYTHQGISHAGPVVPELTTAIQKQHGRQLGHRFILHTLDVYAQNKMRDGNYVYSQYLYYLSRKEPVTISVTESLFPVGDKDGGHSLVPYHAEDLGSTKRIYVYDVNRVFHYSDDLETVDLEHRAWYAQGENYVEIESSTGAWKFYMSDSDSIPSTPLGELWEGSPSSGGSLILFPFSVMRIKDRIPQSLFAEVADALGKIFVYSSETKLKQISTPDGRHYINEELGDYNHDEDSGLRSACPFIPIARGKSGGNQSQLYFIKGEQDFNLDIKGSLKGFKVQLFTDRHSILITTDEADLESRISIRNFHSDSPEVVVDCAGVEVVVEEMNDRMQSTDWRIKETKHLADFFFEK